MNSCIAVDKFEMLLWIINNSENRQKTIDHIWEILYFYQIYIGFPIKNFILGIVKSHTSIRNKKVSANLFNFLCDNKSNMFEFENEYQKTFVTSVFLNSCYHNDITILRLILDNFSNMLTTEIFNEGLQISVCTKFETNEVISLLLDCQKEIDDKTIYNMMLIFFFNYDIAGIKFLGL